MCVEENRLRLVTRDGRTVTPVATHMLSWSRIPELARFLLDVPRDGRPVLSRFFWGSAASLPVLPRLQRGRAVLSPARWQCDSSRVSTEAQLGRWRDQWAPPARCYICDGDNRLLIDLDDPAGRGQVLDSLVRQRRSVQLDEALPGPGGAWLPGPDGPRLVELAVPLRRAGAFRPPSAATRRYRAWRLADSEAIGCRPGTEWLYLKLYLPRDASDALLVRDVAPLLERIEKEHPADTWFFIRYRDPAAHLRLRWQQHSEDGPALGQVVLSWARELQRSGRVTRVLIDRYEREVARYGGAAAMDIAERIFAADSAFVLGVLELQERQAAAGDARAFADRTELAAFTLSRLMADLGVEGRRLMSFCKTLAGGDRAAGRMYRERQRQLRELMAGLRSDPRLEELLAARSAVVTPAAADLGRIGAELTCPLDEIKQSYARMHLNRLVGPARSYEQLIYGLLERTSRSLAASPLAD